MKTIDITDGNFEQLVLASEGTVLVDFGAEWCPPCKAMNPLLEELAKDLIGNAVIGKLDVDTNPESTAKYGVRNLTTFLLFRNGNLVERIVGAVPKSVLEKKITATS